MTEIEPSKKVYKSLENANPISPAIFCADPTGIEYEGRLYVYGTNDHQQYEGVGKSGKNTYEKIQSLVCFSTEDMVNWTYHGKIETKKIAPWIIASWAPSITSRVEDDGLTHFYLYFSNSGAGVGVLTATNPLGPWSDPLKKPLISGKTKGLGDCPAPFDPGVCIDDDGTGWLAFGGCGKAPSGTDLWPGSARIVKLGDDMISLASEIKVMPSPYFFEASELNYINDTFVYTFNTSWDARNEWPAQFKGVPKPSSCSMAYMTSKTPLDMDSWEYKGHYFINPGEAGMNYSNNHSHFMKYKNQYYIFYHALILQDKFGTEGGFRSLCVDTLDVDEEALTIKTRGGSRKGLSQVENFNPYVVTNGASLATSSGIAFEYDKNGKATAISSEAGGWLVIRNVDFGSGANKFFVWADCDKVSRSAANDLSGDLPGEENLPGEDDLGDIYNGNPFFELRLDNVKNEKGKVLCSAVAEGSVEVNEKFTGVHDLYILFSDAGVALNQWKFSE